MTDRKELKLFYLRSSFLFTSGQSVKKNTLIQFNARAHAHAVINKQKQLFKQSVDFRPRVRKVAPCYRLLVRKSE